MARLEVSDADGESYGCIVFAGRVGTEAAAAAAARLEGGSYRATDVASSAHWALFLTDHQYCFERTRGGLCDQSLLTLRDRQIYFTKLATPRPPERTANFRDA